MNITNIYEMLDWNMPIEIQSRGIFLAKKVEALELFIQPLTPQYGKNIWENCAKVLISKSDDELGLYFIKMFMWLQDMNWPGAYLIYNRLLSAKKERIIFAYQHSLEQAKQTNDYEWGRVLEEFYSDYVGGKDKYQ